MGVQEVAFGVYAVVLILCLGCVLAGIVIVFKELRRKKNIDLNCDFIKLNAKIVDYLTFDTPQFFDIYDEKGYFDGVKITYSVNGDEYEKICADMNFDDVVPIIVKADNPNDFRVTLEDDEKSEEIKLSLQILVGLGLIIGGLLCGAFFVCNLLLLVEQ